MTGLTVLPSFVLVGGQISVFASATDAEGDALSYQWTTSESASSFVDPSATSTQYRCVEPGPQFITVTVSDGDSLCPTPVRRLSAFVTCVVPGCNAGIPRPEDPACDGIDAECDGRMDDDYVGSPTECGFGTCAATGVSICTAGHVESGCVVDLVAGGYHTCGLRVNGSVRCWGDAASGQSTPPLGETFDDAAWRDVRGARGRRLVHVRSPRERLGAVLGRELVGSDHAGARLVRRARRRLLARLRPRRIGRGELLGQQRGRKGHASRRLVRRDHRGQLPPLCPRRGRLGGGWGGGAAQTTVPALESFAAIDAGFTHTCGLRADGSGTRCWGSLAATLPSE